MPKPNTKMTPKRMSSILTHVELYKFQSRAMFQPRSLTPSERKIASIRKEIAIMLQSGVDVGEARRLTNVKYGKGWRERGLCVNDDDQWSEEDLKPFL